MYSVAILISKFIVKKWMNYASGMALNLNF